jgi:DNA-binding FrmR family transcriptional regulator
MVVSRMAHTIRKKPQLINRVKRIKGQVEAVERALVGELDCSDVLPRIATCRGAMDSLLAEVMEDHIRFHIVERHRHKTANPAEVGEELISAIRTYVK